MIEKAETNWDLNRLVGQFQRYRTTVNDTFSLDQHKITRLNRNDEDSQLIDWASQCYNEGFQKYVNYLDDVNKIKSSKRQVKTNTNQNSVNSGKCRKTKVVDIQQTIDSTIYPIQIKVNNLGTNLINSDSEVNSMSEQLNVQNQFESEQTINEIINNLCNLNVFHSDTANSNCIPKIILTDYSNKSMTYQFNTSDSSVPDHQKFLNSTNHSVHVTESRPPFK